MKFERVVLALAVILSWDQAQSAEVLDPKFFANAAIQAKAPGAFVLQPEAQLFLKAIEGQAPYERDALVKAIRLDLPLYFGILGFTQLTWDEQLPILKSVFDLQVKVLQIQAPELVFDSTLIRGPAFFEYDMSKPGPGKVILNPDALAKEKNKFAPLALLLHETRHSAQFQELFNPLAGRSPISEGYYKAFEAQQQLKGQLSFVDFCTLLNEYEAFQFANYVLGTLTDWESNDIGMGTYASQYESDGHLKIDLLDLSGIVGPANLLDTFNGLEKHQYDLLKKP